MAHGDLGPIIIHLVQEVAAEEYNIAYVTAIILSQVMEGNIAKASQENSDYVTRSPAQTV